MTPDDLQALVDLPMPFGKYKGRAIADLPGHLLRPGSPARDFPQAGWATSSR
jgi:uncharacterized protein (DUF3820 family)